MVESLAEGRKFVGEAHIPLRAFAHSGTRDSLNIRYVPEVVRGYWKISHGSDSEGASYCDGVTLILELFADNWERAEDLVLGIAASYGDLMGFVTGSPVQPARILRMAEVGPSDGVKEIHIYDYYEDPNRFSQSLLTVSPLRMLTGRLQDSSEFTRQQVELAMRWYRRSFSEQERVDAYVAAWFGLEGIGAILNRHFHPDGPKAPCGTCENAVGVKRDKKLAGIEHVIRKVASEALLDRRISDLAKIRNDIVHGLRSMSDLRDDAALLAPDLQVGLGAGILTVLGREFGGGQGGRWSALLPRDYRIRPDYRFDLEFTRELPEYRPFFNEWPAFEWFYEEVNSRQGSAGNYSFQARVRVEFTVSAEADNNIAREGMVRFERLGSEYVDPAATDASAVARAPYAVEWRQETINPSWQRILDDAENSDQDEKDDSDS